MLLFRINETYLNAHWTKRHIALLFLEECKLYRLEATALGDVCLSV